MAPTDQDLLSDAGEANPQEGQRVCRSNAVGGAVVMCVFTNNGVPGPPLWSEVGVGEPAARPEAQNLRPRMSPALVSVTR